MILSFWIAFIFFIILLPGSIQTFFNLILILCYGFSGLLSVAWWWYGGVVAEFASSRVPIPTYRRGTYWLLSTFEDQWKWWRGLGYPRNWCLQMGTLGYAWYFSFLFFTLIVFSWFGKVELSYSSKFFWAYFHKLFFIAYENNL